MASLFKISLWNGEACPIASSLKNKKIIHMIFKGINDLDVTGCLNSSQVKLNKACKVMR